MKKQAAFLAISLQASGSLGRRRKRPPWVSNPAPRLGTNQRCPANLESNQCVFCKQGGHWKREGPEYSEEEGKGSSQFSAVAPGGRGGLMGPEHCPLASNR